MLSLEEFKAWYSKPSYSEFETKSTGQIPSWVSLQEVRRLTNLQAFSTGDVFEKFAEAADDDGLLDQQAFMSVFASLGVLDGAGGQAHQDADRACVVVERLFQIFDENNDGSVDFSEFASGISVLCGGSRDEKVENAFALYDYNGDGFISLDEMVSYLTNVFKGECMRFLTGACHQQSRPLFAFF
jgi:Ca2+-binding EF-hand superfamily protein